MRKCNRCGGQITFRVVDGQTIPIHLSGGCTGYQRGARSPRSQDLIATTTLLDKPRSYLNPNAKCPVCGVKVFFFQSEDGGRVFFDDVGWPWPKHPCTDHLAAHKNATIYSPALEPSATRLDWTANFMFFKLLYLHHDGGRPRLRLKEIPAGIGGVFRAIFFNSERSYTFSQTAFEGAEISDRDFRTAPSFLISKADLTASRPYIHFVSTRLGKIVSVRLKRVHSVW